MIELNKVYNMDCMDLIESLPDESVDVCLTDPPYGIDYQSGRWSKNGVQKPKIQNDTEPFIKWIEPLYKKMKPGGRLLCFYRWDVQDDFLNEFKRAGFTVKSQIVWDKCVHGMGDLTGEFAPQHELILYLTKGRYTFQSTRPTTMYRFNRVNGTKLIHPNEKPIPLMTALLEDISMPGELIVDLFGGSFSTFIAARNLGRDCVSCELDEGYYNIGLTNVNTHINLAQTFF